MYAPAHTWQMIARGISFRFIDIRTLFHDEGLRHKVGLFWIEGLGNCLEYNLRTLNASACFYHHDHALLTLMLPSQEAGGKAAQVPIMIKLPSIAHLHVNYRTHSGIIDVAASIVDVLQGWATEAFPAFNFRIH